MPTRSRTALIVLAFMMPAFTQAQWVGAVRGWFSTPGCESDPALDSSGNVNDEHAADGEQPKLAARAHKLIHSLPEGPARDLAQELETLLRPRDRLKYVCKNKTETGYTIRYKTDIEADEDSDSEFVELHYEIWNLGRPEVHFDVKFNLNEDLFHYSYDLSNGTEATRPLSSWWVVVQSEDQSLETDNSANWINIDPYIGSPVAPQSALYENLNGPELMNREPLGRLVKWTAMQNIEAGHTAGNFSIKSEFRPGWTTVYIQSEGSSDSFPLHMQGVPREAEDEIMILQKWEHHSSSVPVIGPRFALNADNREISSNWLNGIRIMIRHDWLSGDSPYVKELLEFLRYPSAGELSSHIQSNPKKGMEELLDRIIRMAF